jgi:hypothetical protein
MGGAEEDSLVAESALARLRAFFAFHFAALVLTGARFASVAWAAAAAEESSPEKAAFFISTFSSSTTAFCSSARLEKSRAEEDSLVAESALARLRAFFAFHFAALVLTGARFASVAWAAAASPCRRVAVSPYRRIAVSPYRRVAVSPYRRIAVSPYRRVAVSPYRRVAVSPCRRIAVTAFVVKCRFPVHCSGVLVGVVVALVVGVVVVVVFVVVLVVGDLGRVGWSHGQVGHTKTSS